MVARGGYQVAARNTLRDYAMSRSAFFDRDVSQFGWSAVSPSRPAISQSVGRSGGQGKRTAARSHAQPRLCGEHGEHGEHWTLMAAATGATLDQAGCVGTSASGSHNPTVRREAEAGSPSKSVTATPSITVILLIGKLPPILDRLGCTPQQIICRETVPLLVLVHPAVRG